ncbi:hypothetical protein P280DRAFT_91346 [Massarina eburnea CBS 473.64]|uniref:Uncharacterized protein n=1 Tax=Massarina eburnea CBS 473.64 TaxID=1395130 RepID=A0A6A6RUR1_9PLEO|nr:hypothetical protein P280DRAFT_91346 [Massarina eburnea CBS 473.64]
MQPNLAIFPLSLRVPLDTTYDHLYFEPISTDLTTHPSRVRVLMGTNAGMWAPYYIHPSTHYRNRVRVDVGRVRHVDAVQRRLSALRSRNRFPRHVSMHDMRGTLRTGLWGRKHAGHLFQKCWSSAYVGGMHVVCEGRKPASPMDSGAVRVYVFDKTFFFVEKAAGAVYELYRIITKSNGVVMAETVTRKAISIPFSFLFPPVFFLFDGIVRITRYGCACLNPTRSPTNAFRQRLTESHKINAPYLV